MAKANAVEKKFNVFRAKVDGKEMDDSEVREGPEEVELTPRGGRRSGRRARVGQASRPTSRSSCKLRNQAATKLGFKNYHAMQLHTQRADGHELIKLFDELDELTASRSRRRRPRSTNGSAKSYGVKVEDLMPWHYHDPFFQESPAVFDADLDAPYAKADILKLCRDFYTASACRSTT